MKRRAISFSLLLIVCFLSVFSFTACETENEGFFRDRRLNLTGYELSFCDEFEGDSLDLSAWEYQSTGARRDAFLHPGQVSVSGGNLVISGEYKEGEFGEGWYAGMLRLKEEQTYGYFEIRCIPNDSEDFWSAFWLIAPNCYSHELSQGGISGAEIDIFESYKNHAPTTKNYIASTIHCNGSDGDAENIDSLRVAKKFVPNLRTEYHTFGLLWTESEYVFYIDGYESARSSFGSGVSAVPESVLVSLEPPDEISLDKSTKTHFYVDYVKIYTRSE